MKLVPYAHVNSSLIKRQLENKTANEGFYSLSSRHKEWCPHSINQNNVLDILLGK